MNYLITGLPRSRTAWLAAAVGCDDHPCLHEGLVLGVDGLGQWMDENPTGGDSDSGLPMFWRKLAFPYRLVIVRRDPEEAARSYAKAAGFDLTLARLAISNLSESLDEWALAKNHLAVDYKTLSNNATVAAIIEFCTGRKADMSRLAVLQGLQIEQRGLKSLADRAHL